ncbi:MAG: complex I NDUFA9 subunit family protein [Micavibrio sp.]|nr:complex I NDUFA9 subunit family protein [Micavibrio sp.]
MTLKTQVITVFGGTGFLGRHIIWQLAKTGATIRVATRNPHRAYFLRPAGTVGQIVPVGCNIHDDKSVATVMQGADFAINLVGILNEKGRSTFKRVHVEAAARIAQQAKFANVKLLVHVSALGTGADAPSAYARSKAAGEDAVIHAFSRSVVLRPSVVFGPEDDFFNKFASIARKSPALPLIGGGKTKFQPVYVGDIAKAVEHIIADPDTAKYDGHIFELAGPETYSFRQLMQTLTSFTRQDVALVNLPVPLAKLVGLFAGFLPKPPLTVDQVRSLGRDSVAGAGSAGLAALSVEPTALESILPSYLSQYWPGGKFAGARQAG